MLMHRQTLGRNPAITATEISVRGLEVDARIGVLDHEKDQRQRLFVDVTLRVNHPLEDRVDQALDYRCIVDIATQLADQHVGLIEKFAESLATRCLKLPFALSADVAIVKPTALTNGVASTRVVMNWMS